jgi:hypothetical protein
MKGVELITGQAKPSAMDAKHPIVSKHENQKPHQQYSVVDDRTPQKKVAGHCDSHLLLPSASNDTALCRGAMEIAGGLQRVETGVTPSVAQSRSLCNRFAFVLRLNIVKGHNEL